MQQHSAVEHVSRAQLTDLYPSLADLLALVESEVQRVWEAEPGFVGTSVRKVLSGRGKRLRPVVTLLTAECLGGASDRVIAAAAAVEMIHTASLVHDDVVDEALSRRGLRSAKAVWGNKVSVLLGDYLVARAFQCLRDQDQGLLAPVMAEAAQRMCQGQILEMRGIGRLIGERDYLDIVRTKTGALFGLAGRAGAVTADAPPELQAVFQRFGEEFGLAFQLADDILDLVGTNGRSGKPHGRDLAERKATLPVILAARCGRHLRDQLSALLAAPRFTPVALRRAQSLVRDTQALEQAWLRVSESLAEARDALSPAPDCEAKQALLSLAGERFPLPVMSA